MKILFNNAIFFSQKIGGVSRYFDSIFKKFIELKNIYLGLLIQIEKLKNDEMLAMVGDQEVKMEMAQESILDQSFKFTPNEEESAKINKEFEEEPQIEE